MNKSVFISGKVTDLPYWWVYIKFLFWDFILCLRGYEPFNPVREIPKEIPYDIALNLCIGYLHDCEYIFFIPGWRKSPGSLIEFKEAVKLKKKLINKGREINIRYNVTRFMMDNPPTATMERLGLINILNDLKNE